MKKILVLLLTVIGLSEQSQIPELKLFPNIVSGNINGGTIKKAQLGISLGTSDWIGAGIGAAMGAPMLIRSAAQGAKFMNTGLKGNTVADAFMNI